MHLAGLTLALPSQKVIMSQLSERSFAEVWTTAQRNQGVFFRILLGRTYRAVPIWLRRHFVFNRKCSPRLPRWSCRRLSVVAPEIGLPVGREFARHRSSKVAKGVNQK